MTKGLNRRKYARKTLSGVLGLEEAIKYGVGGMSSPARHTIAATSLSSTTYRPRRANPHKLPPPPPPKDLFITI